METKFTKGEWSQSHRINTDSMYNTQVYDDRGQTICTLNWHTEPDSTATDREANAHLIASAPAMYEMIESLMSELDAVIDEVNTMRDIHHKDPLTPCDDWDKESLHNAQILLAKARGECNE